jgi:hypothetical protein
LRVERRQTDAPIFRLYLLSTHYSLFAPKAEHLEANPAARRLHAFVARESRPNLKLGLGRLDACQEWTNRLWQQRDARMSPRVSERSILRLNGWLRGRQLSSAKSDWLPRSRIPIYVEQPAHQARGRTVADLREVWSSRWTLLRVSPIVGRSNPPLGRQAGQRRPDLQA